MFLTVLNSFRGKNIMKQKYVQTINKGEILIPKYQIYVKDLYV